MNQLKKLLQLFIWEQEEKVDIEVQNNMLFSNLINFILLIIVFSEGIVAILDDKLLFAFPMLLFSCFFAVNVLFIGRKPQSLRQNYIVLSAILFAFSFFVIFDGPIEHNVIWVITFPLIASMLIRLNRGSWLSLGFFAFIIIDFQVLYKFIPEAKPYSTSEQMLILGLYLFVFMLSFTINHAFNEFNVNNERIMINTQNVTQSQEQLIASLSRQIRTPLNNITGLTNLLQETTLTPEQTNYLTTIRNSADDLVAVVNSMVDTSKLNQEKDIYEETSFNVSTIIKDTFTIYSEGAGKTHFTYSDSPDVPNYVVGNVRKFKQIFLNILNRISKHKSEDNRIEIDVKRVLNSTSGKIELEFRLTLKTEHPIVEKSLNSDSESIYGQDFAKINSNKLINYLELNSTQNLIEHDGNSIHAQVAGDFLIIMFTLSFDESTKPQAAPVKPLGTTEKKAQIKEKIDAKDATLLLVEDNASNQQIIMLYLKNQVKKIEVANHGKEALDKFGQMKFDIILMDVQMPVMDGLKATQKIREYEQGTDTRTPIIAVTANAFPEDKEKCMSAGMDDYISKPFQPQDLIDKIKKWVE